MCKKLNSDNHIVVPGFAFDDLKLSGNKLLVFSLICGFCVDGKEFYGSQSFISETLNISRRRVNDILHELETEELLNKVSEQVGNITICKYSLCEKISHHVKKFHRGSEKTSQGGVKKLHTGSEKISHNNIDNNITDNIEINTPAEDPLVQRWQKFEKWINANCPEVQKMQQPITQQQFYTLIDRYSVETISQTLSEMNNWKPLRTKNRSAYQTLINWINRRNNDNKSKQHGKYTTAGARADATIGTNFCPSDI